MSFHEDYYGLGSMNVSFIGEVNHSTIEHEIHRRFRGWKQTSFTIEQKVDLVAKTVERASLETVHVPDKTSADLVTGHGIGIHRDHKDYYSVMMSHFILGGNFSARLMATIRDQEGLTYGIHLQQVAWKKAMMATGIFGEHLVRMFWKLLKNPSAGNFVCGMRRG